MRAGDLGVAQQHHVPAFAQQRPAGFGRGRGRRNEQAGDQRKQSGHRRFLPVFHP
jgi:hypothetical protein